MVHSHRQIIITILNTYFLLCEGKESNEPRKAVRLHCQLAVELGVGQESVLRGIRPKNGAEAVGFGVGRTTVRGLKINLGRVQCRLHEVAVVVHRPPLLAVKT